ncbi:MAG: hypothetical protein J0I13_10315 [Rhizobiales bacterium]|jgi:hypothetical protein|nr:hypothetical protein [Hyphomicrobiales bacterium]
MIRVVALLTTGLIVMALASPADAARRSKRAQAKTGPLIMTGIWGPQTLAHQAGAHRARKADICVPLIRRIR